MAYGIFKKLEAEKITLQRYGLTDWIYRVALLQKDVI